MPLEHFTGNQKGFLVPWDPSPEQVAALSCEAAEPADSDTESLHWGSTWVWFPAETAWSEG